MKITLIDNYDSFTYNLKALLLETGAEVEVLRNDKVSLDELQKSDALVYSPGPGIPDEAGMMKTVIRTFAQDKPQLGICLGMQAMAEVFGSALTLMERPIHGFSSDIHHRGDALFTTIPSTFEAAHYHSWVVDPQTITSDLEVIATTTDQRVMAIKHTRFPLYGFQFHPESVLTPLGSKLIHNFAQLIPS